MNTERMRGEFAAFLKENGIDTMLSHNSCVTVGQDESIKYERIDRYNVMLLTFKELKKLLAFCNKHGIIAWFGADKLCIGYNYTGNMRLSAYDSVHAGRPGHEIQEDRNNDELRAAASSVAAPS